MNLNKLFLRLINSAIAMTWGSFLARAINIIVLLPLILSSFSSQQTSIWFLFLTIFSILQLADIGFTQSFSRAISFAMGGASEIKDLRTIKVSPQQASMPNIDLVSKLYGSMKRIYLCLALLSFILITVLGTWSLIKPINDLDIKEAAWISWGIILVSAPIYIYGILYTTYLMGTNNIALIKRWDIITNICSVLGGCLIILANGGLLMLVINNQFWLIIIVIRNSLLCRKHQLRNKVNHISQFNWNIFHQIWPSSWRSAIGIIMSYGIVQFSGIYYAQFENSQEVASYLLALRIITILSDFSRVPYYSKLPLLAILRARNEFKEQLTVASKGMILSYWILVISIIIIALTSDFFIGLINSQSPFVSRCLWITMGIGVFLERYGAMHIQLYSTTNHIIWHKANGISGLIYIGFVIIAFNELGVFVFPVAQIVSNLAFYSWYSAHYSLKSFELNFFTFEKKVAIPPALVLFIFGIYIWFM
ncbi:hypothetical protein LVD17_10805 [Fulvivirga ulvae]|uniref:hypothetical protein n=1 Tax=Fulvivirga ulvae TaxID=2904245 RepID=UPI001F24BFA9|nr:hypothetical protein [Fulvivirga ulvae]UII34298.1 hypothetical protein LVD17_10805 [Fulvivirga ulvae]